MPRKVGDDTGPKTIHEIREESIALQVGNVLLCTHTHRHTEENTHTVRRIDNTRTAI